MDMDDSSATNDNDIRKAFQVQNYVKVTRYYVGLVTLS